MKARATAAAAMGAGLRLRTPRAFPALAGPAAPPRDGAPLRWLLPFGLLILGVGACILCGVNPVAREPWFDILRGDMLLGVLVSVGGGLSVAALTIFLTRALLTRVPGGKALEASFRPSLRGLPARLLLVAAVGAGVGEELFFRGFVDATAGIVVSSVLFGLVHQVRGPGRIPFMISAALFGATLALLYRATGSLAGPLVAHVLVNYLNALHLREDASPAEGVARRRKALGGLLRR